MATGCALGAGGILKNASDIEFFESETDSHPIRSVAAHEEPGERRKAGLFTFFFHSKLILMFYVREFQANDLDEEPRVLKWLNISPRNI